MGLLRLKWPTWISLLLAIILLVLACITVNRACYDNVTPYSYQKIKDPQVDPRFANSCRFFCDSPAVKLKGTPTTAARTDEFQFPAGRIARCSWEHTGRHLFLALTSWAVLWLFIELLLSAYRRFHPCLNIIDLLLLGFAIPTAIYLINDLYNTDCGPWEARGFLCYGTIFNVSFILLICFMVALLVNLIWNLIKRRQLNDKPRKQRDIPPQEPIVTAPVVVNEAPMLAQPISGTVPPVVAADERIS